MVPTSVGVVIVLRQAVLESARVLLALGFHQKFYLLLFLTFLPLIHPCDRPVNTHRSTLGRTKGKSFREVVEYNLSHIQLFYSIQYKSKKRTIAELRVTNNIMDAFPVHRKAAV
jgi:hypothetical protein